MTEITRRRLLVTTGAILATAPFVRRGHAAETITLGAVVPITGPFAASGIQYYNSLQLAVDDINAAGGINGAEFAIAFEDTQGSNSTAVNAFVKLSQQLNPPIIFLSSLTTQNLATEPEVLRAETPSFYAGGSVAISDRKNPWMFGIRPNNLLDAEVTAYGVKEIMKVAKPGFMHTNDDYGTGAADTAIAAIEKTGIKVIARESFSPRDNDFSAQLLSLKNQGVDSIIAFTYNRDGPLIMKQRRSLGITVPFLCGSAFLAPSTLALCEPADVEGIFAQGDAVLGASISPESQSFVERYDERFGFKPDPYGASLYDAALIAAQGLREVGPDKVKLQAYLRGLKDFKGVTRTYSCDETQTLAHSVVLVKFKPGTKEFEKVAEYPPA